MIKNNQQSRNGKEVSIPLNPLCRNEKYLDYICKNGIYSNLDEYAEFSELYSNDISIPATMLSVVSSLVVGAGVTINSSDDIYDLGRMFYGYIQNHNELTWDFVQSAFVSSYTVIDNYIHIDNDFLGIVNGFLDKIFYLRADGQDIKNIGDFPCFNVLPKSLFTYEEYIFPQQLRVNLLGKYDCTLKFELVKNQSGNNQIKALFVNDDGTVLSSQTYSRYDTDLYASIIQKSADVFYCILSGGTSSADTSDFKIYDSVISFPYNGAYNWDNINDRKSDNSISMPIPSNLGNLVGQTSDNFWINESELAGESNISIPVVDNSSISVCEPYSFLSSSDDTVDQENALPIPQSRIEKLLYAIATGDNSNIEEAKSRIEQYLHYILNK